MNLYVKSSGNTLLRFIKRQSHLVFQLPKNKVLLMKLSILAIFLSLSGILLAANGNSQELDKVIISITLKDATLKQALRKIEGLAKISFTYKTNDITGINHISFAADKINVAKVLEKVLQNTGLKYEQVNSNIIIKKIKDSSSLEDTDSLSDEIAAPAFTGSVKGKVTDEKGDPLAKASIEIVGAGKGTAAGEAGEFIITGVTAGKYRLTVSAVGYQSQTRELTVKDNEETVIDFLLKEGGGGLDEVVVVALGIKKEKRALGYSTQEVKGSELAVTKQTNIVNALRGKVAGVQINSGGGAPGQGAHIVIRGVKSLSPGKNNQPLFVIDGIVMDNNTNTGAEDFNPDRDPPNAGDLRGLSNRAADINPDDIESINILRGGAATALYGQAGSNGVVVLTTKSAKAGKMRIDFTTTYGFDEVNKFPEVQSTFTQGYVGDVSRKPEYDATSFWPNWGPTVAEAKAIDPTHPDKLYDHYKQGYQTGNQFRSSINLSGGTEKALLSSSFSFFKQNGVIPNSDYKSISARLGGQFQLSSKLKFNPSFYFINSGGYHVNADRYNENLTYWAPRWNAMDFIKPDGTQKTYGEQVNPVYGTYSNRFRDNVNRMIGNTAITYSPFSWVDLDYKFGMDYYTDFRRHAAAGPKGLADELPYEDNELGFVDENRISNRILSSNAMLTFKKTWVDKLNTTLRVGNDVREIKYSRLTATGAELDIPDLLTLNNAKIRSNSQYEQMYRIVSAYGDLSIAWNNFLFLNITGRNDWSSTLAIGKNSFFYPSASLSYVFSDQFKSLPSWLSFGKLRVSYAEIGKDTDPYEINTYYNSAVLTSTSQVLWTRGDQKGDPSLKPERTSTFEAGTELRFFNNRLGIDFTWYKLNSKDQIIPVSISPTTGFTSFILNAGEIENKGIELVLTATPVKTKDFTWDATVNFSRNKNKIVKIREGLSEIVVATHFGYSGSTATMKYVPGFPVGNIYGSSYQRYYGGKEDDEVTLYNDLPLVIATTGSNAGFPVRDGTQRILGNSQPDWIGGITNTLAYKNFTLSFLWETQQGQYRYNQLDNFLSAFGIARYTEDRTQTKTFPGVLDDGSPNTQAVYLGQGLGPDGRDYGVGFYRNVHRTVTENFVEDASWIRLRNLSVGYTIPPRLLKRSFVQGATVTFTGNNLLLFTDYRGFDPETSSFSSGSNVDAFSGFTYPALRSFLFSVNLNF